jgi:HEAT repeat protein
MPVADRCELVTSDEKQAASSETLDGLVAAMLGPNEHARYHAALALARLGRPAIEVALGLLASPDVLSRDMACYVLGQVSDPHQERYVKLTDGIPALLHVLETDPDEAVRGSAACAVGHLDAEEATPLLCRLVIASTAEVRFQAAWALGSFGEGSWERTPHFKELAQGALLMLTHDVDDEIRDWAVFGLHQGDHNTPQVLARFWEALEDMNLDVRGEAAAGLAKFGDRSLIPRLIGLLENDGLSPLYFEAAEVLGDPVLLPAVLTAERRWRDDLDEGEDMHTYVTSAVSALKDLASARVA